MDNCSLASQWHDMVTIKDFWRQGAMLGSRALQCVGRSLRSAGAGFGSEACVKRGEDGVDEYVHAEIRRLRRLLGLPPAAPSPGMVERRRRQVRDRVRRFRERRAKSMTGLG